MARMLRQIGTFRRKGFRREELREPRQEGHHAEEVLQELLVDFKQSAGASYERTAYKSKSVPAKSFASSGKRVAAPVAKAPAVNVNVKDSGKNYTVKSGDTLFKIAKSQGLNSWQDLYSLNQDVLPSANLIFVGQSLDCRPSKPLSFREMDRERLSGSLFRGRGGAALLRLGEHRNGKRRWVRPS